MGPDFEAGRYRLTERIEEGSDTWIAEDLEDPSARCVVKVLPEDSDVIAVRHLTESFGPEPIPGINPVIDTGELPDGRPFLVYPFVEGSTLREYLNSTGPLPLGFAAKLLAEISRALESLHERRILYGVLSPEHIVITPQHDAVLLNAGAFRVIDRTSASPGYLAPEQSAGKPVLASDVFSVAAVAAEMLTGRRAFRYGSLQDLARLQRIGLSRGSLRKLRKKIPLRAEEEIRRALSWDPPHRPSDVALFGSRMADSLGREGLFPKRRLLLLGAMGVALTFVGLRRCKR